MASTVQDIAVKTIRGNDAKLGDYAGKVALVVNVASQCGLTPQYAALEALYQKYSDKGLVVLGFPANDFGAQEPGSEPEIEQFCTTNYGVSFPMFAKIAVTGADRHPLYNALVAAQPKAQVLPDTDFKGKLAGYGFHQKADSDVLWNFEKFLIDKKGNVVARFNPDIAPDDAAITSAIEAELAR